jgi:S-adenosylmethionine/arginine decarboxylase-like enzyme
LHAQYERAQAWGLLASIDLHGCDLDLIQDPEAIRRFVIQLCERINMVRHGECQVEAFGEGDLYGYSVFQFIETSSITGHFDHVMRPGSAYIDIFSCKYFDPQKAADFAKEFFKAEQCETHHLLRA